MPRKNPTTVSIDKLLSEVSLDRFLGKYVSEYRYAQRRESNPNNDTDVPRMPDGLNELQRTVNFDPNLWAAVDSWWPVCLLRRASKEDDSEGFKRLLYLWLSSLGIQLPKGVLARFRRAPGRPRKPEIELILERWFELGKPFLSRQKLARSVFGNIFIQASSKGKNKLVNRCRRAVERRIPSDQIPRPKKANKQSRPNP